MWLKSVFRGRSIPLIAKTRFTLASNLELPTGRLTSDTGLQCFSKLNCRRNLWRNIIVVNAEFISNIPITAGLGKVRRKYYPLQSKVTRLKVKLVLLLPSKPLFIQVFLAALCTVYLNSNARFIHHAELCDLPSNIDQNWPISQMLDQNLVIPLGWSAFSLFLPKNKKNRLLLHFLGID